MVAVAAPYVGQDRRTPVAHGRHPRLSTLLLVVAVVGMVGWLLLVRSAPADLLGIDNGLTEFARVLAAALFLTAGSLLLAAWRLGGRARAAWQAIGLIAVGSSMILFPMLGITHSPNGGLVLVVPGRQVLLLAAIGVIVAGLLYPQVHAGLRPARLGILVIGGSAFLAMIIARRTTTWMPELLMIRLTVAAEYLIAVLWTVLAVVLIRWGLRDRRITEVWSGGACVLLAAAETLRAAAGGSTAWSIATGLSLVAAVGMLAAAAMRLWELLSATGTTTLRLSGALHDVRSDLQLAAERERERLHDARSAVVSVLGASSLLAGPARSDEIDPQWLHRMMTAELRRLDAMLDPDHAESVAAFRLDEVLEPLVLAHRAAGARIDVTVGDLAVIGRREATASAVANLLINARTHAPGADIAVTAHRQGADVLLTVTDDGPGIPPAERAVVTEPGARGSTAQGPGNGIGLATAAAAARLQRGSLEVLDTDRGASVQLRLPAADTPNTLPAQRGTGQR